MVKSMNAALKTSPAMMSEALPNAISSLASVAGPMLSALPDGATIDLFGQEVVPASRSATRVAGRAKPTSDTYGQNFDASSLSAILQSSLESRLRARLGGDGSPEYELIWKSWPVPSQPPICALRASARHTSVSAFAGWPTPMAGSPGTENYNPAGNTDSSRKTVALVAGWSTPKTATGGANSKRKERGAGGAVLQEQVRWVGGAKTLSNAATEKPGALNPAFSLWLMGYPAEWQFSVERAMQSTRSSPRTSSRRPPKPSQQQPE